MIMVFLQGCSKGQEYEITDKQTIKQIIEQTKYYDNLFQKGDIEYKCIDKSYDYYKRVLNREFIHTIKFTFEGTKFIAITNTFQHYWANHPGAERINFETTEFCDGKDFYRWTRVGNGSKYKFPTNDCSIGIFKSDMVFYPLFVSPLDEYVRCMSAYINETDIKKVSKMVNSDGSYLYKIEAFINERKDYLSHDELNKIRFHTVHCPPEKVVYIVDPQKQFLPKEILFYEEGYIDKKLVVNSYCQDNQGNWFPAAMMLESYIEKHLYSNKTFEFYKVEFNSNVSLTLTLPVGVEVEDARVQPSLKYDILRPVQYSELQDPAVAEKEGKIRIHQSPK